MAKRSDAADDAKRSVSVIPDRSILDASEDEFTHDALALQLTKLVRATEHPTAIGVFGPWGSGKSGLLALLAKDLQADAAVVEIDARKYADAPLSRQFVAQTAEQLAVRRVRRGPLLERRQAHVQRAVRRQVREQLYETRRVRRIRGRGTDGLGFALLALGVAVGCASGVVAVWSALENVGASEVAIDLLRRSGGLLSISAVAGVLASLFTIDSDLTRPTTQEEFEDVARRVIKTHVDATGERVVLLIDELDRASAEGIAAALDTLRIFFDIEGTVFVVAVDREVLEAALLATRTQEASASARSSYASHAGSFLDKLFQLQVELPPVRQRRLTHYALELVAKSDGVWVELDVEELVPILIPSHVRSPRRVKVLLNAFSMALEAARERFRLHPRECPDPSGKETALAKLVCLQTEFPLFARDLLAEPKVIDALTRFARASLDGDEDTDQAPEHLGDDLEELLDEYAPTVRESVRSYLAKAREVESPLPVFGGGSADEASTSRGQRIDELLAYLLRTADVPHPGRDLIYGQSLGHVFSVDPQAADDIEDAVVDGRLRRTRELFAQLDLNDRAGATRLLCHLAAQPGVEGRRGIEALMHVADLVADADVSSAAPDLQRALVAYWRKGLPPVAWIPAFLSLAKWMDLVAREEMQLPLLATEGWREDEKTVAAVMSTATHWAPAARARAREFMPALVGSHPETLVEALGQLDPVTVEELWTVECWTALAQAAADPPESVRAIGELLAVCARSSVVEAARNFLPSDPHLSRQLLERLGPLRNDEVRQVAAWLVEGHLPIDEWGATASALEGAERSAFSIDDVLVVVLEAIEAGTTAPDSALTIVRALASAGGHPTPALKTREIDYSAPWVQTAVGVQRMVVSAGVAETLAKEWPDNAAIGITNRRMKVVCAGLEADAPLSESAQKFIAAEIADLSGRGANGWQSQVRKHLGKLSTLDAVVSDLHLYAGQLSRGEEVDVRTSVIAPLLGEEDPESLAAIGIWLSITRAPAADVWDVLRGISTKQWRKFAGSLATWSGHVTRKEVTELVLRLLKVDQASSVALLSSLDPSHMVQKSVASELCEHVRRATNSPSRKLVLAQVEAVRLTSEPAQRAVATEIFALLESASKSARDEIVRHFPRSLLSAPGVVGRLKSYERRESLGERATKRIARLVSGRW